MTEGNPLAELCRGFAAAVGIVTNGNPFRDHSPSWLAMTAFHSNDPIPPACTGGVEGAASCPLNSKKWPSAIRQRAV